MQTDCGFCFGRSVKPHLFAAPGFSLHLSALVSVRNSRFTLYCIYKAVELFSSVDAVYGKRKSAQEFPGSAKDSQKVQTKFIPSNSPFKCLFPVCFLHSATCDVAVIKADYLGCV